MHRFQSLALLSTVFGDSETGCSRHAKAMSLKFVVLTSLFLMRPWKSFKLRSVQK